MECRKEFAVGFLAICGSALLFLAWIFFSQHDAELVGSIGAVLASLACFGGGIVLWREL